MQEDCTGLFMRKVFVTKMKITDGEPPSILVPRVW